MPIMLGDSPGSEHRDDMDKRLKRVLLVLGFMAVVVGGVYGLRALWPVIEWVFSTLSPFLIALVLAYIFNPVVSFVQRRLKLGRATGLAVVAVFLAVLVIALLTLLAVLLLQLNEVFVELGKKVPPKLSEWSAWLTGADPEETRQRIGALIEKTQINFVEIARSVLPKLGEGTLTVAGGIASGVSAVFSVFFLAVFVTLTTFYFLLDFHRIPRVLRILVPDKREERFFYLLGKVDGAVGGYLRGQLTACCCVAILATILMMIVGPRQWAVLIGCLAGAVNFIPYLGPIAGATPAILWALFTFRGALLAVRIALILAAFGLIHVIDGLYFQPKIVGRQAHLHPLVVLLALVVGAQFGIGGMIVAVPVACIVRVLVKELWWDAVADHDRRRAQSAER